MKEKMNAELNKQINKEIFSAYLYLSMAAHFESINLKGFANWMRAQYQEELFHATKIFDFIHSRGGKVTLGAIETPKSEWASPVNIFEEALKHEQFVTESINNLVSLAKELKDYATESFLQWFVNEQVEEEESANEVLQKLKIAGDRSGLLYLDKELGKRERLPLSKGDGDRE